MLSSESYENGPWPVEEKYNFDPSPSMGNLFNIIFSSNLYQMSKFQSFLSFGLPHLTVPEPDGKKIFQWYFAIFFLI